MKLLLNFGLLVIVFNLIFSNITNIKCNRRSIFIGGIIFIGVLIITQFFFLLHTTSLSQNGTTLGVVDLSRINFYGKDVLFLKLFGQTRFGDTSLGTVVGNRMFHSSGVIVDQSSKPNRIYAVDTGNNRILGFKSIGSCFLHKGTACTNNLDCGISEQCITDPHKSADIIIGQPSSDASACNGDNNIGMKGPTNASLLCFTPFPATTNPGEFWMRTNIDVDSKGNLYIPDVQNNRVLRYNKPFSVDRSNGMGDGVADAVWGQETMMSDNINLGLGKDIRTSSSLYTSMGSLGVSARGVSIDSNNNLWVADTFNSRVLRFPKKTDGTIDKTADLVLGQNNFTLVETEQCSGDPQSSPLNRMCAPTLAKIRPDTGELYVLEEYPDFLGRILVFKAPFINGMAASRMIFPKQDGPIVDWSDPYIFRATGFTFNTLKTDECIDKDCVHRYKDGVLWVNEHNSFRTLLLDDKGTILQVIGAPDAYHRGCSYDLQGQCGQNISQNLNLCWPGGSIGMDNANNIYLADEQFNRIARFAVPYKLVTKNTPLGIISCLPTDNGGLLQGPQPNSKGNGKWSATTGMLIFGNQLIVRDENRFLVWNDYLNKPYGADADIVVTTDNSALGFHTVDDKNRLWISNGQKLLIYQLPFTCPGISPCIISGDVSRLAKDVPLYWSDDISEVSYNMRNGGLAFDPLTKKMWMLDSDHHRLLRIKNYDLDPQKTTTKYIVDAVIGQRDKTTTGCNQGRGENNPSADSLCDVNQVKFDRLGNLFVVDNTYECHANDRIFMFPKEDLLGIKTLFPKLEAKKSFVVDSPNLRGTCNVGKLNEPFSPVSLAFNSKNEMVVGNDGYYGDKAQREKKQLWFYHDPLSKKSDGTYMSGQAPDGFINLPMGAPAEMQFDAQDNLAILDHTWSKLWMININFLLSDGSINPDRKVWLTCLPGSESLCQQPVPTESTVCKLETRGDVNCDKKIDMIDFEIFREEMIGDLQSLKSDFDKNKKVNLADFEVWRENFFKQLPLNSIVIP